MTTKPKPPMKCQTCGKPVGDYECASCGSWRMRLPYARPPQGHPDYHRFMADLAKGC